MKMSPRLRLGPFSLARAAQAAGAGDNPPLTSLVDMMTILVVFLLVNFSVQGELSGGAAGLRLPASASRERPLPALSIELGPEAICLEGRPLIGLAEAAAGDSLLIAPLAAALRAAPRAAGPRRVTLQCDRDQDFALLRRVIHTCSASGIEEYALLVRSREGSP